MYMRVRLRALSYTHIMQHVLVHCLIVSLIVLFVGVPIERFDAKRDALTAPISSPFRLNLRAKSKSSV
jgi:hypothetical protein